MWFISRSEATKQSLIAVRHCEPKGWQVCWREAISSLLILVGVRRSGEIASPDYHQARNGVTKTLLIALQRL